MKTFKNKLYKSRVNGCTQVVFCEAEIAPDENWSECEDSENKLNHIYTKAGVRYFGYL